MKPEARHLRLRRFLPAAAAAAFLMLGTAGAAQAAVGVATIYSTGITSASNPWGIVSGASDGNLWYTGQGKDKVVKVQTDGTVTEYSAVSKSAPKGIAINPLNKGQLWYAMSANIGSAGSPSYGVAYFTTATPGTSTTVTGATGAVEDIAAGPTAAGTVADPQYMWFTEPGANKIGKVNIQGGTPTITEYTVPTASSSPTSIILGPDNKLWFTEKNANKIGRIDPSTGTFTEFAIPTASSEPTDLTVGYDNKIYFTEFATAKIGRIDPATATAASPGITEFSIPTASAQPYPISIGPDGLVWFVEANGNKIGSISSGGTINEYALGTSGASNFYGLAFGPDGRLWATNANNNKIIATVANPPLAPSVSNLPPDPYNGTSTSITLDGVLGATFECSVNNVNWYSCTSPWNAFSSPWNLSTSDGLKTVYVRASTTAGGTSTVTTATWTEDRTAPAAPTITSNPSTPTNSTSASFSFTGEAGATFTCSIDGGAYSSCTSAKSYTGLSEGSHTFSVKATDAAGNTSTAASYTWTVDTTAPAAPTIGTKPASLSNVTSPSFSFTGEASATFTCSIDGGAYGSCSSPKSYSSLADGSHTFAVKATDAAGNTSTAASYTWTIDATAPAAPVLSGAPSAYTSSTSQNISWTGEAGATFTCSIDGGAYSSCTSPSTRSGLADGAHSLSVKATDAAGNTSTAATASWTVDTAAPSAPVLSGAPSAYTTSTSQNISWTGEAGATFTCSIDGGAYSSCTSPSTRSGLADGAHSLSVKATDAAGNTSTAATASWTVDTAAPSAPTITAKPSADSNSSSASFSFTGEASATFECKLDGGSWSSCSSPKSYTSLTDDGHTFQVRQTDQAGNTSAAASWTWTVDTAVPAAPTISTHPGDPTNQTSASFSFTGEAGASFQCRLDGGSWGSCSSPKSYTSLSDATHTFEVRQADTAGNVSTAASFTWQVDSTLPDAPTLSGEPNSPTRSTSASITISGLAGATFECKLDSGSWASCTSPYALSGLSDGVHTVSARQRSSAGSLSGVSTVSWTVDTTAPAAPDITIHPLAATTDTSPSLSFEGEAGATFECRLDGGSWASCTSPKSYTSLADGSHTFEVRQTDGAGNVSPAASQSWTLDTVAPSAPTITGFPADPSSSTSATLSFTGELGATYECKLDDGSWTSCTSAKSYSSLSDGSHTFQVRQTDEAGNTGTAASYTWTVDTSTPAAPSIDSKPSSPSNDSSPSFAFSGEAGATFECRIDSGSWGSCSSPKGYTSLSDGSHTFEVRQTDAAGNTGTAASSTWTLDATAPSAPSITSQPSDPASSDSATFSFTGEGSASFECKLDSGSWTACTSSKSYTSLSDGSHTFQVRQTDAAGNTGTAASYTWTVDTSAPAAPTIATKPSDPSNDASPSFSFSGEAGASFQCRLDSGSWASCTSAKNYTSLSDGSHTFEVRQTDAAGNTGTAASYTWTLDTASPSAPSVTSQPSDPTSSDSATFSFTGEASASFECKLDSGSWTACTSPQSYSSLSDGSHTFRVRQTDAAGNTSSTTSASWTVDTSAPTAPSITGQPGDPSNNASPSFSFTGEAGVTFECRLDGGSWGACTSPQSYSSLADGSHTFEVRATDAAGNTGTAASYTWTLDTSAPAAPTVATKPSDPSNDAAPSFTFSGEAGATLECKLDSGSWTACTSPQSYSALADGSHTFRVRQTDAAGNVSSTSTWTWTLDTGTPAAPTIGTKPSSPSNDASPSFSFSGEAGASFQCRLDSGSWASCSSPKSYTSLSDGSHTFEVKQTDGAGNTSTAASYTWTLDTSAPSAPTIGTKPSDPSSNPSPSFSFSGEAGSSFECRLDSGSWAACTSTKSYTSLSDGSHTFQVRQTDAAGNTGTAASYTWTLDTSAPSAPSITSHPSDPALSGSASFSFTGEAGASFECRLDSGTWAACTSTKSYTSLSDGSHTFQVRQTDAAGNTGTAASYTWTLDTSAPSAPSITSHPSDPALSGSASFSFTGEAGASFECRLDSGSWTACTSPQSYSSLSDGSHTFRVRQTDAAGNTSTSTSWTWTVDTGAPPAPSITSKPDSSSNDPSPSFSFTGEAGATFECRLDSGSWTACTSPKSYASLSDGSHTFEVRQLDSAGNASPGATWTWDVDTAAPSAPAIGTKPTNPSGGASPSFSFTGEAGASFECRLDTGSWGSCTSPQSYSSLSDGSHTFRVRQTDAAGNTSSTATWTWTIDTAAPSAPAIGTKPTNPSNDVSPSFTFTAESGATLECKLDSGSWGSCSSPKGYSSLSDGSHTFQVRATDAAGNTSSPSTWTWTIDTVAPTAPTITGKPNDPSVDRSPSFSFTGEADAAFECRLDSEAWTDCASPKGYSSLADGTHTFRVRQTDEAGNLSSTASWSWTIDGGVPGTPPSAPTVTSAPAAWSSTSTIAFTVPDGAQAECRVDDGSWEPCTSPFSPSLSDGRHQVELRAASGGLSSSVVVITWNLDRSAPSAPTMLSAPDTVTPSTRATFDFTGEPGATLECSLDDGPYGACASPMSFSGLAAGDHVFRVRQTDQAGNGSDPVETRWTIGSGPGGDGTDGERLVAKISSQVELRTSSGGSPSLTVGCELEGLEMEGCSVELYVNRAELGNRLPGAASAASLVLIGNASARPSPGSTQQVAVRIKLNSTGRRLLRSRLGGFPAVVQVSARPVEGLTLETVTKTRLVPQRQVVVPADGVFASGSARLTRGGERFFRRVARQLPRDLAGVTCAGHTDAVGPSPENYRLGKARAKAVCTLLRRAGVRGTLRFLSFGEARPRASNRTARGRTANRRVELTLRYRSAGTKR